MKSFFLAAALLALVGCNSDAADYVQTNASGTTAATATLLTVDLRRPRQVIQYDVTSDKAASVLAFISATQFLQVVSVLTNTTTNSLTITVASTNGISGGVLVQRKNQLVSFNASVTGLINTNQVVMNVTNVAVATGDWLWVLHTNTVPIGAATVRQNGECLWFVAPGRPLQVQLDGTSACSINNIVIRP